MPLNSKLERLGLIAAVFILLVSLQFGACLAGAAVCLPVAILLSIAATWLWLHFDLPTGRVWLLPVVCAAAVLVSVVLVELTFRSSFAEWFACLLAGIASLATEWLLLRTRARCGLCNRRLASQDVVFACPRCTMAVCDETCWNFEHRRCQLCLEQRVPVLSHSDAWWLRVTGPRARHDRCQICRGSAAQVDLRGCPHCRRAQCRDCWDFNNGECSRCGTALPDLPASLTMTVARTVEGGSLRPV